MPAKKRQDQSGCYPKLAVSQNWLPEKMYTSQKAAFSQKQRQANTGGSQKLLPANKGCQPNVAASQK